MWPNFTRTHPWAVRCPAGTYAHMLSEKLSSAEETLHLRNLLLLAVTDTSCHKHQRSSSATLPAACLTVSFILHYIIFSTSLSSSCVTSLCASFPVFHSAFPSFLIFLPASRFSSVMHCCRGHLLCPSLFMIPSFGTLAQKDTSMKYSPAQLAVKWFTQACLSCICDLYPVFSCLHWSYLICLVLSGTKHGIPAACYSLSLLVPVISSSCWEWMADAHLLHCSQRLSGWHDKSAQ